MNENDYFRSINDIIKKLEIGDNDRSKVEFSSRVWNPNVPLELSMFIETCAAFANSGGGQIVFGVSDDRSLNVQERLIGIEHGEFEFFSGLNEALQNIWPPIAASKLELNNRKLPNGNLIDGYFISLSLWGPIAVSDRKGNLKFFKRTNLGNEFLSIREIRLAFKDFYAKYFSLLPKVKVLQDALIKVIEDTRKIMKALAENTDPDFLPAPIDYSIVASILEEIESMLPWPVIREITRTALYMNKAIVGENFDNTDKQCTRDFCKSQCQRILHFAPISVARIDELWIKMQPSKAPYRLAHHDPRT